MTWGYFQERSVEFFVLTVKPTAIIRFLDVDQHYVLIVCAALFVFLKYIINIMFYLCFNNYLFFCRMTCFRYMRLIIDCELFLRPY